MTPGQVGVLDYGSGNLHSVCRALAAAGAPVLLSPDPEELKRCLALVVPGVGAFSACMVGLRQAGGDALIRDWVATGRPLLGICVGHQVLFARGVEHAVETTGVGIFPGVVEQLVARRLPHMGWNTIQPAPEPGVFTGISDQRFYFLHSYGVHATTPDGCPSLPDDALVTWARHEDDRFVAAVRWRNVTSTQFHPEKSGRAGARLLTNWLATASDCQAVGTMD